MGARNLAEGDPIDRVTSAFTAAAGQVYGATSATSPPDEVDVEEAAALSPDHVRIEDAVQAATELTAAGTPPEALQAELTNRLTQSSSAEATRVRAKKTTAAKKAASKKAPAKKTTSGAEVDGTEFPPMAVEASAPNMLTGAARQRIAWALLGLAFASLVVALFSLSSDDKNAGVAAVAVVVVAAICVIGAWFTTMGYGKVTIRSGAPESDAG
jgi:hypothetical protein